MKKNVDVLEVLRYNANMATKKWGPDNQDAATLAAVAELIEAAGVVEEADRDGWLDDEIVQRMRDALSRCGGSK